jgi:N-acetylneuraminate lyase
MNVNRAEQNVNTLKGILPATITPFDDKGRFASAVFERLLDRLYAAGVHGVYVCGTTGEGMLQSARQREAIVEAAVASTPRGRHVVAHVGAASLDEARALAVHAAKAGTHAISSLPPLSASFSFLQVRAYYESLAQASDLPLVVYYFPEICSSISTADQLESLCALPNVIGVKFTDFDLYKMSQVLRPERCVFNGRDEVLAAGLLMGANGGIGTFYNLIPDLFVRIYTAAEAGRWDDARAAQQRVNTLIRLTLRFPLFPAVKQILEWSGLDCGPCLPPRSLLTDTERDALRESLVANGFDGLIAGAIEV